jgi:hypothetical protein
MSHPCCWAPADEPVEKSPARRIPVAPGLIEGLALAASPTFFAMALLAFASDHGSMPTMCGGEGASWIASMGTMYVLMGAFHAPPWLRWLRRDRA